MILLVQTFRFKASCTLNISIHIRFGCKSPFKHTIHRDNFFSLASFALFTFLQVYHHFEIVSYVVERLDILLPHLDYRPLNSLEDGAGGRAAKG